MSYSRKFQRPSYPNVISPLKSRSFLAAALRAKTCFDSDLFRSIGMIIFNSFGMKTMSCGHNMISSDESSTTKTWSSKYFNKHNPRKLSQLCLIASNYSVLVLLVVSQSTVAGVELIAHHIFCSIYCLLDPLIHFSCDCSEHSWILTISVYSNHHVSIICFSTFLSSEFVDQR